jgi:hypothetical protein
LSDGTRGTDGIWALIGALAAVTAVWMAGVGLSFDWASALLPALACLALVAGAAFYRTVRPDARLAAAMSATAQLTAFTAVALPLSYAAARTGRPLWDATLLGWDQALHLDWPACLAFMDARPGLSLAGSVAYASLMPQMIVAIVGLCFQHHLAACRNLILAIILAALTSILISALMPAMTVFMHLGLEQAAAPHVPFINDSHILALRAGTLRLVSLTEGQGIIAFPSFHAALGILLARAFWSLPGLRWPGLILNLGMIAATPTHGGHYFVDVFAGIGVGLLAVTAVTAARHLGTWRLRPAERLRRAGSAILGPDPAPAPRGAP